MTNGTILAISKRNKSRKWADAPVQNKSTFMTVGPTLWVCRPLKRIKISVWQVSISSHEGGSDLQHCGLRWEVLTTTSRSCLARCLLNGAGRWWQRVQKVAYQIELTRLTQAQILRRVVWGVE